MSSSTWRHGWKPGGKRSRKRAQRCVRRSRASGSRASSASSMAAARRWRAGVAVIAAMLALTVYGYIREGRAREPETRAAAGIHPASWRDDRLTIASLGHAALLMD